MTSEANAFLLVIASASEAIQDRSAEANLDLLRRFAPLRKRFAFVAGNADQYA